MAWPPHHHPLVLAIAFAPLVHYVQQTTIRRAVGTAFLGMLLWNFFTTFWIRHATLPGALFAVTANALIFTVPWWALAMTSRIFRPRFSFLFFVLTWITWEYFHLHWELAWPWLTLGNAFAVRPEWVQWYAYTGVLGGSIWIWWVTYALLYFFRGRAAFMLRLGGLAAAVALPITLSYVLPAPADSGPSVVVGCIQPNIDPYEEKFDQKTAEDQLETLIALSEKAIRQRARIIIWPETAIPGVVDEDRPDNNPYLRRALTWLQQHRDVWLITGAVTQKVYVTVRPPNLTARRVREGVYVDYFNSLLAANDAGVTAFYHKKKLVPGVESLPYPRLLGFLRPLMADLGGVTGGYGTDEAVEPLALDTVLTAPAVCYESVFGDFLRLFVQQGAHFITVATNDGWWGPTDGYRQHFHYARLRAVELRRWTARSANTGISGIIDPQGQVIQQLEYDRKGVVVGTIRLRDDLTYYARTGDYLGRLAGFLLLIFAALAFSKYYVVRVKKFPYIR